MGAPGPAAVHRGTMTSRNGVSGHARRAVLEGFFEGVTRLVGEGAVEVLEAEPPGRHAVHDHQHLGTAVAGRCVSIGPGAVFVEPGAHLLEVRAAIAVRG